MTTMTVSAGETSSGLVLNDADVLKIVSGGSALSTTVNAGGVMTISSGGFASATQVSSAGIDQVLGGGIVSGSIVTSGGSEVLHGSATSTLLGNYGTQDVFSGGTATSTAIGYSATQEVFSGGIASDALGQGVSIQIIAAGGTAISAFMADESGESVSSGGVTSYTVLSSYGSETVSSGGLAVSTTVGEYGGYFSEAATLIVSSGGTTLGAVISHGFEDDDGITSNTVVLSGGTEYVSGGTAIATVLDVSGAMVLMSGGTAAGGIIFNGQHAVLDISGTAMPTTSISGFAATDTIDLLNLTYSSGGTATFTSGVLTVSQGGQSYDLTFAGPYDGATFTLAPDALSGTDIVMSEVSCFAAGTRIRTDRGDIAVEALAIGDRVMTASGEALPIRWIGHRLVDCRRHPRAAQVLPVRVAAHALALNQPSRDLFLSPDHAIFAEGVLIPVKHLINGGSVRQVEVDRVRYFHIELPVHAVIIAEGLAAESYLDTGDCASFETAGPLRLHPAFGSELQDIGMVMDALGCAPLRVVGPEVDLVRQALAERQSREADCGPRSAQAALASLDRGSAASAARTRSTSGPVTRSGA